MKVFGLPISCPQCGGDVTHVDAVGSGTTSTALLRCDPCDGDYHVEVLLRRVSGRRPQAGTVSRTTSSVTARRSPVRR